MAKPSKKGAKSEAEVAAEAKRKKEILDQVAQSNLPTKTILKELGISRSTYYSWLKRYEEEGEEGLLDSRSLAKAEEEKIEVAPPVAEVEPEPPVEVEVKEVEIERPPEPVAEEVKEEEAAPPPPEEPVVKPPEPVAPPVAKEPEKEEEVSEPTQIPPVSGGEARKGLGGYAFLAVVFLVVGLLVSISLSNYNTYKLEENSNTLTLWKGKFAPRGFEMVESFKPVEVGDTDVSSLTGRIYTGKAAVYKAIFGFYIDQVNGETARGDEADMSKISLLLDRAEDFMDSNGKGEAGLSGMRFQLAQQRVAIAELGLHKAYQKALPIYQEALKTGLGDTAALEAKVESMQKALGLVPVVAPEVVDEEAEVGVIEEESAEVTETVAPPESISKEAEATAVSEEVPVEEAEAIVAPEEEGRIGEDEAEAESAEEGEIVPEETGAVGEPAEEGEKSEKKGGFLQWLKSKRANL